MLRPVIFYVILISLQGISVPSSGQRNTVQNLPKYDQQRLHFGFLLGTNKTDFVIRRIGTFTYLDSLYVVEVRPTSGFNLGIVSNLRLGNHFDLRFVPDLSFAQRDLIYSFYVNDVPFSTTVKQIESTFLEFPLELKFKSARVNNYRAYVTAGIRYSIDMVSQAKVENKDRDFVRLSRKDYGYTIGLGFDFYMQLFKLSPEIKMYHGIPDMLVTDNKIFSASLNSLRSKIFMFSLTFE
ncbi:MAG: PorT family protein [Bacteroidia bacterium]|nr:PorT family protein [Bacteroidia bacterium]MCZ2276453.1 PorT family protein [Bacteroidia bacterium]